MASTSSKTNNIRTLSSATATDSIDLMPGETAAFSVTGTFSATWSAQRSLDEGTTWGDLGDADGNTSYTGVKEIEYDARIRCKVRINCSAYTSGTIVPIIRTGKTINA